MDVLNKLYCTVSSTVSQLSTVLPGNPVTREYEATSHIASAGPGLLWKIFSGFKKSTNQEASIFLLEKKQLERLSKNDREAVLETIRKSISQLARLRHPQILVVQHTLEESRDSLAFATEPVFASLSNILGKIDNIPAPVPPQLDNFNLFDVEIKYGLQQVAEGLSFLHNDVKLLHRNLCPNNIIINKEGAWKIFGFDYSVHCISGAEAMVRWPTSEYAMDVHALAQPNLDYLAPESGISGQLIAASDIFSFGMMIYALYNKCQPLAYSNSNWTTYNQNISKLKRIANSDLFSIPEEIREIVKLMLNHVPELRPELHEFLKSDFFDDVGVKAMSYLDSMFQWDNLQKSQFYKGLPQIIEKLPHRICLFRIVPCLAKEFVNPIMVPFVLPSVFAITENCTKEEFTQYILSYLKPVLKLQEPVQILLICMQKMELLLKLTPADDIKTEVLPLLFRALECNSQQLQELCLSVIPTFASLIDYPAMKNALLPRIKKLCVATNCTSVRVNCLVCMGKLMENLDKWLILDDIIPFLPQVKSKEPAVLMSIIGIYKLVLNHKKITIPKEVMAGQILPFLVPLSIENSLTLTQFNAVMTIIKDMINMVELEHRAKLEQLNSIQEQQKNFDFGTGKLTNGTDSATNAKREEELRDLFEKVAAEPKREKMENQKLNLKEKQTLSKQKELQQRLQMEPKISPIPVAATKAVTIPKDLTSTLINNNLAEMKLSTPKTMPNAPLQMPQSVQGNPNLFNAYKPTYAPVAPVAPVANTNLSFNNSFVAQNKTPMNSISKSSDLSPAAFFTNNLVDVAINAKSKQPAKPLTSSEINDFLN